MLEFWILAIAAVASVACALCGTLLLVSRKSMVSEGLSHAVLPGLVIAFILIRDYNSPLLILSAGASGLVMVWLTQLVQRSGLVDSDAGLGIVFAGMFSVGILIVSAQLRNTHFHADCIIDGNLALAPLDRLKAGGIDWGPRSLIVMSVMLLLLVTFIVVAYKEIKIGIFDPVLAERFRLRPAVLQMVWLSLVSLTTVAAFDVAGSVLIVALMIAPPAAASLLTDRLGWLFVAASGVAILSSFGGYYVSALLDISPTGPIASFAGMVFLAVFLLAPRRGLLAGWFRRIRQRAETCEMLVLELIARDGKAGVQRLSLSPRVLSKALSRLTQNGLIREVGTELQATSQGHVQLQQLFRE